MPSSPFCCAREGSLRSPCTRTATLVAIIALGLLLAGPLCLALEEPQQTTAKGSIDDQDFYAVLGLEKVRDEATDSEIKSAWRKLSKKYHPDVSGEANRQTYQRIQRAYEVLGDRRKRKVYDILGLESVKKLEQPGSTAQASHPFFQLFGGHAASDRGADLPLLLRVPLPDAYTGATHRVRFPQTRLCRACRGTGARRASDVQPCGACHGEGRVVREVVLAPGFVQRVVQTCPGCGGRGRRVLTPCPACAGRRVVAGEAVLGVALEAGTPEGLRLTFELEADQTPGRVPGDVVVTVVTAPHPVFERRGEHLHTAVRLSLREALLGFERGLRHLDGHEVRLTGTGITAHGERRVVQGEGMPRLHVPSERGDLHVTFLLDLPEQLTEAQREALEVLD